MISSCAAAPGLVAPEDAPPRGRRLRRTLLVTATAWAIALTVAMTLHYQGETVWGVPDEVKQNYQHLRQRLDGFFGVPHR